ncbi:hypothetical protein L798_10766 [Zootermopsis nevadensis]|uniref:Uncharacterized protein n=1 Tax=Zootermopsis nevadensis TaxID=136037 RepID=A0A067QWV2_ZOONE|nr:hypothetical protein L798_10766 [Zootermopsis nevadensis]
MLIHLFARLASKAGSLSGVFFWQLDAMASLLVSLPWHPSAIPPLTFLSFSHQLLQLPYTKATVMLTDFPRFNSFEGYQLTYNSCNKHLMKNNSPHTTQTVLANHHIMFLTSYFFFFYGSPVRIRPMASSILLFHSVLLLGPSVRGFDRRFETSSFLRCKVASLATNPQPG